MHGQLLKVPEYLYFFGGLCDKLNGEVFAPFEPGAFAYSVREPLGVVGAIIPWNSPILLAIYKMAPALAAGNTVVVKPSEHTSASILEVMRLVEDAGFPPGVVNVVTGAGVRRRAGSSSGGQQGLLHRRHRHGGGWPSGRRPLRQRIPRLGGKSPNSCSPTRTPRRRRAASSSGIFAAAGQTCIAGSRAFVHASLYDEMATTDCDLAAASSAIPSEPPPTWDPSASKPTATRVEAWSPPGSTKALPADRRLPAIARPRRLVLSPTVLGDVANDMRVSREEIFGPVLSLPR